jgi:hypothetical protein
MCTAIDASKKPSGEFEMSVVVKIHRFKSMHADGAFSVDQRFLLIPNQCNSKMVQSVGIIRSDDGWQW